MLIVIAAIGASIKESAWKQEQIKEDSNNPESINNMLDTYVDSSGVLRDRYTNKPRTTISDKNGDRVLYDEKMRPLLNITQELYEKALQEKIKTAKPGDTTVKFSDDEVRKFIHDKNIRFGKHLYVDIYNKRKYIIVSGNRTRFMKEVNYYFDYELNKVVRPTDSFLEYLNRPEDKKPMLTDISRYNFYFAGGSRKESLANNLYNVSSEIKYLQRDIDQMINEYGHITPDLYIEFPDYDPWERYIKESI